MVVVLFFVVLSIMTFISTSSTAAPIIQRQKNKCQDVASKPNNDTNLLIANTTKEVDGWILY
jgi:hypothetical protein